MQDIGYPTPVTLSSRCFRTLVPFSCKTMSALSQLVVLHDGVFTLLDNVFFVVALLRGVLANQIGRISRSVT